MYKTITFVTLLSATLLYTHRAQCTFGNEYVHIKVHLPKEHAPVIVEAEPPRKVIHHYHHKSKSRPRAPKKPSVLQSPLLESVILSELDKPLHANEHAEYLNHAKELAEHISKPLETYVVKKPPSPPLPPKKIVNTYTIIEEKIKPTHEHKENYAHVETYKVIDTKLPTQHHHSHGHELHHHHDHEDHDYAYKQAESHSPHFDDSDSEHNVGYQQEHQQHYHEHEHRAPYSRHQYGGGGYAEPAPVEEPPESDDDDYRYQSYHSQPKQQHFSHQTRYDNKQREEDAGADNYYGGGVDAGSVTSGYSYNKRPSYSAAGEGLDSFRPSPQIVYDAQKSAYGDDTLMGGYLPTTRRPTHLDSYSRPLAPEIEWPEPPGYNTGAAETYRGIDSYSVGHVQGVDSGGYQYSSPYA